MVEKKLCNAGVDIGGTFTDIVLLWEDGTVNSKKVLSTPPDYALGIVNAMTQLGKELSLPLSEINKLVHGTTVATNLILEGKGARTALLTTKGFRDVLELRRIRIPRLYDLFYERPNPLVPRHYRLEVQERIDARGSVLTPLNEEDLHQCIVKLRAAKVEAVAVCFLNSFAQPIHERRAGELIRQSLPDVYLSLSSDVLPEIREYERMSTTCINSYVGPIVKQYLDSLTLELASLKMLCPLLIMQSSGGIMTAQAASQAPAHMIESGPAAGVVATSQLMQMAGYLDVISFDMGGTTAKAALIEKGKLSLTSEAEVGGGINLSSKLTMGRGYTLKLPMIDLSEVGAGGGSIARIKRGMAIEVGPDSAGAFPGPVCYDRGGDEITVSDVNVILGYINPEYLAGGSVPLNADKARKVFEKKIAAPLGKDLLEAAYGIHVVANARMIRAVKAVTTYRGRDPRDFSLVAFGGSGPVHAAHMARSLGIRRVIVPVLPGLFSALGLLLADVQHHSVRTFLRRIPDVSMDELNALLSEMENEGRSQLAKGGHKNQGILVERYADLRYQGQAFELTVSLPHQLSHQRDLLGLEELFGQAHDREYGHRASDNEPVEIVNLRVALRIPRTTNGLDFSVRPLGNGNNGNHRTRQVYYGPSYGSQDTAVLSRWDLTEKEQPGPLIVEEYDSTTLVPPDCRVVLDQCGNIVLNIN
ncbi:MAG: hydantoinase/oxoprolinase family protein [Acidobacteria bacterium]|nr:hydantoinase/oxoprolinase family protein [Acidobacteriota bacterium]MCI0719856.1 hydantoinase/oxoprolinase family protein [Acidobacteriota bacterium]